MRRDASREDLVNFRKALRPPPQRVSTLAEMQTTPGGWVWLHRDNPNCSHLRQSRSRLS